MGVNVGLRHSFDLFYPADRVGAGLAAVELHQPASRRRALADDAALARLTPDVPLFLELAVLLPADSAVRGLRSD